MRWVRGLNSRDSGAPLSRPVNMRAVRVMNDSRDKLLAGLSENSRRVYEQVFDIFWEWAVSRYSPPRGVDPLVLLAQHRRDETKPGSSDSMHCERIVDEWYRSLSSTDLAPSSAERYRAVLNAIFCSSSPSSSWGFAFAGRTLGWAVLIREIFLFIFVRDRNESHATNE